MEKPPQSRKGQRLEAWAIILFALGVFFTQYPVVQLFNQPGELLGFPLLIAYMHGIWIAGIVCLAILARAWRRLWEQNSQAKGP